MGYEAPESAQRADQGVDEGAYAALEAARRPEARQVSHQQAQVQTADVHQQALEDVRMVAQIDPAPPSGFVQMRVGTFEPLAALAQQPLPAGALNPPPVGIHRVADLGPASPVAPTASRLRHVTADAQFGQGDQCRVAVLPLVADHLGETGAGRQHRFELLGRLDQRLDHRRRVAGIGVLDSYANYGARLQIHRVLGLVGQVGDDTVDERAAAVATNMEVQAEPITVLTSRCLFPARTGIHKGRLAQSLPRARTWPTAGPGPPPLSRRKSALQN